MPDMRKGLEIGVLQGWSGGGRENLTLLAQAP